MEDKEAQGYWWCAECHEEVSPSRVTYAELHDACGHPVVYVEPKDPIAILRAQLAEQAAEVRRWKDLYESMERTWKRTEVENAAKDRQLAAAVSDIPHRCWTCANGFQTDIGFDCEQTHYKGDNPDCLSWQWRGPQEAGEVEHGSE